MARTHPLQSVDLPVGREAELERPNMIKCNSVNVGDVKRRLRDCLRLLENFEWLINSFVLDFFLDSHWNHLPRVWRPTLINISPPELADWLDPYKPVKSRQPWPLSLLAFKQSVKQLSLDRRPVENLNEVKQFLKVKDDFEDGVGDGGDWEFEPELLSESGGQHASLKHVFRKHVKPKKQYEMCRLAKLVSSVARSKGLDKVLDIGSGVGHLSRYLCYNNKLQVACIDGDDKLTASAQKFDQQLEFTVDKMLKRGDTSLQLPPSPVHVTCHIAPDMDLDGFHSVLLDKFSMSSQDQLLYGIMGLHTCGDLGPVLLRMFSQDQDAVMLHSVGCCYMKIKEHFPMSSYLSDQKWHKLTYTSNELACHALETYVERLRQPGMETKLKVHCYRAILEQLLVEKDQKFRHTILKTVARAHKLPFAEYVNKATAGLVANEELEPFSQEFLDSREITQKLERWWEVVTFYTLRLALAPVIETVILLDRCLYLYENGLDNLLIPLFDPLQSPRNQVLIATKL